MSVDLQVVETVIGTQLHTLTVSLRRCDGSAEDRMLTGAAGRGRTEPVQMAACVTAVVVDR